MQVTDWKLVSEMTYNVLMRILNPTHSQYYTGTAKVICMETSVQDIVIGNILQHTTGIIIIIITITSRCTRSWHKVLSLRFKGTFQVNLG